MSQPDPTDGVTYLIQTGDGSEEYVVSMLEKYYGDLLDDVSRNPADCDSLLLVTTSYELPSDAFRRYVEIEDVVRIERQASDERDIEDLCADLAGELPGKTRVSVVVRSWGENVPETTVGRRCCEAIRTANPNVSATAERESVLRIDVIGDWVGIGTPRS